MKDRNPKLPFFSLDDSREFLDCSRVSEILTEFPIVRGKKKWEPSALNVIASFDIEATSFYHDPLTGKSYSIAEANAMEPRLKRRMEKRATMYAWGFGLNGKVVFGRTWMQFLQMLSTIKDFYKLGDDLVMKVFIQNESYEFQFIKDLFKWKKVFATSDRYPVRATTADGFEFCDSLIISGMSLENMGESLHKYSVKKLVGSLDYRLLRHSGTYLSDNEWLYLKNDNLVLMAYMEELLEERKSINAIPMTKTGFVREDVRNYFFWGGRTHHKDVDHRWMHANNLMRALTLSVPEYLMARRAFTGGFTHGSSLNVGVVILDVDGLDIASSYPASMLAFQYPMSKGKEVSPSSPEEFEGYLKKYCCLFDIEVFDLESSFIYEHIISKSKCFELEGAEEDNGRLIRAKRLRATITEIDWECWKYFYTWKSFRVGRMFIYRKAYLPKAFIEKILEYYKDKTELRGVVGMEAFYARSKTLINSIFGMMVQNPIIEDITYIDGEWVNETDEIRKDPLKYDDFVSKEIEKYNKSRNRFTSYLWGVWVCKYSMRNILSAIRFGAGEDYIYTDTDSVKMTNYEKHREWFEKYNKQMIANIAMTLRFYGIDEKMARPTAKDGKEKPIGVFEWEGRFHRFLTKGAKRYFVDYGEPLEPDKPWTRYNLTISGVSKSKAIPKIYEWMEKTGKDFFEFFTWGRVFDGEMSGKLTHLYIDEATEGTMIDYLGKPGDYKELSSVHLEESSYKLTPSDEYKSLLDSLDHINAVVYID